MRGGSILSYCSRNLNGHERVLKVEEVENVYFEVNRVQGRRHGGTGGNSPPHSSQSLFL